MNSREAKMTAGFAILAALTFARIRWESRPRPHALTPRRVVYSNRVVYVVTAAHVHTFHHVTRRQS